MPNTTQPIVGAVPVLVTPFKDNGSIDLDSMRSQIDFCLEAGSQALAFGIGSESQMLTDAERGQVWSAAAKQADGKVPVIAAPAHPSREGILALSQIAKDSGVDCLMVNGDNRQGEALVGLFRDLSERVGISLMVQDVGNAPAKTLVDAAREAKHITCMKIEGGGAPNKIGLVVEGVKEITDRNILILGGSNGNSLPEEFERGSTGTLPHPAIIDAFRQYCDLHQNGDIAGADAIYYRDISPLNRLTAAGGGVGGGIWLHKIIFERAGIINSAYFRINVSPQPDWIMDKVWAHLKQSDLHISKHL